MKKLLIGVIVGALLLSPAVFCNTGSIAYAKLPTKAQKIYTDVRITGIEDMTQREDRVFHRDVVENMYRNSNGKIHEKTSFYFKTMNGTPYVIHSYGSMRSGKVGFFILGENKKKKDFVYMNQPRYAAYFRVYKMTTSEPDINLWVVISDRAAANSGVISGFYVFMDKGGKLTTAVTDDEMAAFGMPFDNREQNPPGYAPSHYLNRNLEDGKLYLEYAYEYWDGNMSHAQAKKVVDKTGYLAWDNSAQTFVLTE